MYSLFQDLKIIPKSLKWKIQKAKRGFSDNDVKNLDLYLIELIPNMLNKFIDKQTNNNFPMNQALFDEAGIQYEEYLSLEIDESQEAKKRKEEIEKQLVEKWNETLTQIIFCFTEQDNKRCTKKDKFTEDELNKYKNQKLKEGFNLLNVYFHNLWW